MKSDERICSTKGVSSRKIAQISYAMKRSAEQFGEYLYDLNDVRFTFLRRYEKVRKNVGFLCCWRSPAIVISITIQSIKIGKVKKKSGKD